MKYIGTHNFLMNPIVTDNFLQVAKAIEFQAGYHSDTCVFKEYESAWIDEYNWIGRKVNGFYYSMVQKKWVKVYYGITEFHSWSNAKYPVKNIAQYLINFFSKEKSI